MTTEKCPTCGSTLHVATSKEGTSFFIPVDVGLIDTAANVLDDLRARVAELALVTKTCNEIHADREYNAGLVEDLSQRLAQSEAAHSVLAEQALDKVDVIRALKQKLAQSDDAGKKALAGELIEALGFYADPSTYFAIGFFPDHPCGDFINDFSKTDDLGMKPGKRARKALKKLITALVLRARGGRA